MVLMKLVPATMRRDRVVSRLQMEATAQLRKMRPLKLQMLSTKFRQMIKTRARPARFVFPHSTLSYQKLMARI
jgi:hypothetical protein